MMIKLFYVLIQDIELSTEIEFLFFFFPILIFLRLFIVIQKKKEKLLKRERKFSNIFQKVPRETFLKFQKKFVTFCSWIIYYQKKNCNVWPHIIINLFRLFIKIEMKMKSFKTDKLIFSFSIFFNFIFILF